MTDAQTVEVDRELAQLIRAWRVDEQQTWREIAARVAGHLDLPHSGNQLAGRDLCLKAARLLGEDPDVEPWN
ncbi:hypothetical protein ABJI51_42040 [Amycolatopsis sp. NEAU-NG30]|uniref:Uncharacterized protein n=1 Tax=Amycolatopsis melonis TaxID=3156488 RepID=A0ABV0LTQ6_9PSEU